MRRFLTALLLTLLLGASLPSAHAQDADAEYFESLNGLERIVARSFMAPMTGAVSVGATSDEVVTPDATAQPASTPETASDSIPSGTVLLSIFVYEFDSPDNASKSFEIFDADLQDIITRDLSAPMTDDLPLVEMGDQAKGYMGDLTIEGITLTNTFATVQDNQYVYSLMGQFVNLDGEEQTQDLLQALIDSDAGPGDGEYREDGTSTGGLWDTFARLEPDLAEGSTTTDLVIYPQPDSAASTDPSNAIEVDTGDMHDLHELDGIRDAFGITYLPEESGTSRDGVFRIESWILPFDSQDQASQAVNPLSNTLTEPIDVNSRSNQNVSVNGRATTTSVSAGPIRDESLPNGIGVVNIQQIESTVYVVVVYAIDGDPAPVSEGIIEQMISTPAGEEPADAQAGNGPAGGTWDRFLKSGDPVLEDLILTDVLQPEVD